MDRDAILEVSVSEDAMTAYGTFLPAVGSGRMFTSDYVDAVLESAGVVHGIRHDEIADAILACNTGHHMQENIPVATGSVSTPSRPAYWDLTVATVHGGSLTDTAEETERIDYKDATHLQVVYAGDKLAVLVAAEEGEAGMDVYGRELAAGTEAVPPHVPGANTRVDDGVALAEVGGRLVVTSTEFLIEDYLEISGDIGFATGSIEFPGDVSVKGEIKEGFHIWAGGTIHADRTVDVSEIYCRGDFSCAGGIIGRGKALLRSGGSVHVRFVGNCYVESKDSVVVKQYAYHGRIGCLGSFSMEKGGRIIGGVVTAAGSIECGTLGNNAGIPTHIRGGVNFIVERKMRLKREKHHKITTRLDRLTARMGDHPTSRQLEIVRTLEKEQKKLTHGMSELAATMYVPDHVRITVTETVYPGVVIQIGRAEYAVVDPLHGTEFSVDPSSGHIVARKIETAKDKGPPKKSDE